MDFSWSKDQTELYEQTLEFATKQLNKSATERDINHTFGAEEWRHCGEFGLLGLPVAAEYGGMGLDALTTAYAIEALGRGCEDAGLVFSISAHEFACVMPIAEHASEELKKELLPPLCNGQWIGANAITEAEAGSDAFALKTKAERDGDDYVLNGVKSWVTNGPVADVFMVYAATNPAYGFLGLSAFAIPKDAPGLLVGKPFTKVSLSTSPTCSLYMDDCRVPARYRVGPEGHGGMIFQSSMGWERACLFAAWVGLMDRQLEQCIAYARERSQFGQPIGKNQAISNKIADMRLRLDSARLLLYRACWTKDQGREAALEIALSKLAVSEALVQSSVDAVQIHGAVGVVADGGIERALRDGISSTIYSGTSEIQRQIIAQRLGL